MPHKAAYSNFNRTLLIRFITSQSLFYAKQGKFSLAIKLAQKALLKDAQDGDAIYNIVRIYALMDKPEEAFEHLYQRKKYLSDLFINIAKWDPDLDNIRNDPRFKESLYGGNGKIGRNKNKTK